MSDLGILLAALHDADRSYSTVDARWLVVEEHGGPDGSESRLRVAGDRWREDRERDTFICVGDRWWTSLGRDGPETGMGRPVAGLGMLNLLLLMQPGRILGAYNFAVLGTDHLAGRPVLLARATERPRADDEGMLLPWESLGDDADEHVIAVDVEHGVVLRCQSFWEGELVSSAEVTEIVYDAQFSEDLFAIDETAKRVERTMLVPLVDPREAAARVPFGLYLPVGVPDFQVTVSMPDGPAEFPPMAFVDLSGREGHIHIHQHPVTAMIEFGLPRRARQEARLRVELGDTLIMLTSSDVDEARLAEIAATLDRVEP